MSPAPPSRGWFSGGRDSFAAVVHDASQRAFVKLKSLWPVADAFVRVKGFGRQCRLDFPDQLCCRLVVCVGVLKFEPLAGDPRWTADPAGHDSGDVLDATPLWAPRGSRCRGRESPRLLVVSGRAGCSLAKDCAGHAHIYERLRTGSVKTIQKGGNLDQHLLMNLLDLGEMRASWPSRSRVHAAAPRWPIGGRDR